MTARNAILSLLTAAAMVVVFGGCNRTEYICSAYQSAFFVDKAYANQFFSTVVDADSQPLVSRVLKNEYLLIKPIKPRKKEKGWAIVPMITVFPESLKDSTAGDSTQVVPDATEGQYQDDGVEKTNFLEVPGETPRQKRRREKKEAKEKEKADKEKIKAVKPKQSEPPIDKSNGDPEKPF
jgi:hypothetical protein